MFKHFSAILLMPTVTLVGGCGFLNTVEKTETLSIGHVEGSSIDVETVNGSITIKKSDRKDVEIKARIRARSDERLDQVNILTERAKDGKLTIRVEWPDGSRQSNEGVSFEILLPDAKHARLKSSNGKLNIAGLSGDADLRTSNGSITVQDHDGPIDAQTSNGKINIAGATHSVKVKTSNGSLKIGLASAAKGPINARTSNGSVTLDLSPSFSGNLSMQTSNGSIKLKDLGSASVSKHSKKKAEIDFGGDGEKSMIRTSNGSIRVNGGR